LKALRYLFSSSYRKRRWAVRHLAEYRALCPRWLFIQKIRRTMNRPLIFEKVIGMMPSGEIGTIVIPKFREITAIELADDIPMN